MDKGVNTFLNYFGDEDGLIKLLCFYALPLIVVRNVEGPSVNLEQKSAHTHTHTHTHTHRLN